MWTTMSTPIGELRIVAQRGALTAIDFMGEMPVEGPQTASMAVAATRADGRPLGERADDDPLLCAAVTQLGEYFRRDRKAFDLPLNPTGSDFQRRVWARLSKIGYGETATYGEIAGQLGMTGHAARAVGLANGRNPIPVVVPCHRVVGANGSLTGYGGGIERKQTLLDLEQDALF